MPLYFAWIWWCCVGLAAGGDAPTVVLISLDTTRVDALSCYGRLAGLLPEQPSDATPRIDALAAEGLRFERFYAHAPTTLSSHTSMLSGQDPHQHAIPRNGFPVSAELPTLQTRLGEEGYDTIAAVGAKALESSMGLSRGFRVYDDTTPNLRTVMYQDTADQVVERAIAHVDARPEPSQPLFLFVHLYDAHAPYEAPAPFREAWSVPGYEGRYKKTMQRKLAPMRQALESSTADPRDVAQLAGLYQAEVAFLDQQVGRLLDALEERGLLDHALVVLTADHGETLHDDPAHAYTHGPSVGEEVMRVPLVMWSRGVPLGRGVVSRTAGMSGLAPTIEVAAGLEPRLGEDFWDLARPGPRFDVEGWPARPSLQVGMEATRPFHHAEPPAWNNLDLERGLHAGGGTLRVEPSLWEVSRVTRGEQALGPTLEALLREWDADAPPFQTADLPDETRSALEALGYLDAGEK